MNQPLCHRCNIKPPQQQPPMPAAPATTLQSASFLSLTTQQACRG